ncbi:MAG: translesion error-prone DNA polymerase V autoproteolytic subunit [Proteobacteria bacterium]|nr:translesion error-prone DNA polymerase V autoproteolytic subunit [Pseudomonadota bacterium]
MTRGGKRAGAGRPKGSGKFGEATAVMRIPQSMADDVARFLESKGLRYPLYASRVQAGFPSPADDFIENRLSLDELLIRHPAATFMVRATGESMIGAGILPNDVLVVDRSQTARHGKIVIAAIGGELTVKRLHIGKSGIFLMPENPKFDPIPVTAELETVIWGVVTGVVRTV